MQNFASRMMLNILSKSAFAQGLLPTRHAELHLDDYAGALIPMALKKKLLNDIVASTGIESLLQQDSGVAYYQHHPCLSALLFEATPVHVVQRWQRLERYIHSDHYLQIISQTNHSLIIGHQSRHNIPPTLMEDMAVMGVLQALFTLAGAEQVQLQSVGQPFMLPDGLSKPKAWQFEWQQLRPPVIAHSSLSDSVQAQFYASYPNELQRVAKAIGVDDLFSPRLAQIASHLHLSSRSLQRKLQQHGATLSQLVQKNRLLKASHYLLQSDLPLAEIGFLSGFSDQSHFCRVFKTHIGTSPQVYRGMIKLD